MKYKNYDPWVKKMIIDSGNPNLFPELNIPRTTALYWVKHSKNKKVITNDVAESYERRLKELEAKLCKERAKVQVLSAFIKSYISVKSFNSCRFKRERKRIVQLILSIGHWLSIKDSLHLLGLHKKTFSRWRAEVQGCQHIGFRKCPIKSKNQLTYNEQTILYQLATDKKYESYSVKSLQWMAIRERKLCCSYDTWLKYIKKFGINRNDFQKKVRPKLTGVRAECVNQLWHMDVSEFKLATGEKFYLQMIVDNYSRYIVDWNLSSFKNARDSVGLLKNAIKKMKTDNLSLMSDGGGENCNSSVRALLSGRGIQHQIVGCNIKYSNSMIEYFFRKLKTTFLRKKILKSEIELRNKIKAFVKLFNMKVPISALDGRTPNEVHKSLCDTDFYLKDYLDFKLVAEELRSLVNSRCVPFSRVSPSNNCQMFR